MIKSENKLGEIRNNKFGTPMQIIDYKLRSDIRIKFLDKYGYEMNTTYQNFKIGQIKNPYDRTTFGVGYVGIGKYFTKSNDFEYYMYETWRKMFERCYDEKTRLDHKSYIDCLVANEWHCFQDYAEWYVDNFYQVGTERMHVDKDILFKNNKIYSPNTCIIVPQRINMIFMTKQKGIDVDLPNAIRRCVHGYQAAYNGKSLGVFKTVEDAIEAHDTSKRIHIKKIANEYKDTLPDKVYDALIKW